MLTAIKTNSPQKLSLAVHRFSTVVQLNDGKTTTVHVVRYPRRVKAKLILFERETYLIDWCRENGVQEAINGGYFVRKIARPLGEHWIDGSQKNFEPYSHGWNGRRGSLYLPTNDHLSIQTRESLPELMGSFCEAGPTLVSDGQSTYSNSDDPEGFKQTMVQHDAYINAERFPRAAIGYNDKHVWTVSADGRTADDAGLLLSELAVIFLQLGVTHALNLDGGSSTSHISNGKLVNIPRGTLFNPTRTNYAFTECGRPVFSAVTFEASYFDA